MTLRKIIDRSAGPLAAISPNPRLDAEVLAMHALGLTRSDLITRADRSLSRDEHATVEALVQRRVQGEPVAYIVGNREFWSLLLNVTPATLIPRPETELLVEQALLRIPADAELHIADLGTGSGAVALAIARERPGCQITATDICHEALAVARENAAHLDLTNVEFRRGSWLAPFHEETFDLIVSNPPYVRERDPHLDRGDVRHEPRRALVAGHDGLDAIRHIASRARKHLRSGGHLLLEHGYDQAESVASLCRWYGYRDVTSRRDLADHERVTTARLP